MVVLGGRRFLISEEPCAGFYVAEVLVGLATDATVYLSRRRETPKVNN